MAYGDLKNVARRKAFDKILHDKAFNIVKNPNINVDINVELLQWSIIFLIKTLQVEQSEIRICQTSN